MQLITIASAAMAALPIVNAATASIYNKCDFDFNIWSVSADGSSDAITIKAGDKYTEPYRKPSQGGVSLKMMNNTGSAGPVGPVSQFEYTLEGFIWYDMSNVDCSGHACPFAQHGWYLDSTDHNCPTRNCLENVEKCIGAYTYWNNDINTLSCDSNNDIQIYMCITSKPDSNDNYTPAPSSSSPEAPASEPTQVQVQQAQVEAPAAPVVTPSPVEAPPHVVTEIVYVTQVSYEMVAPNKRHVHHARHPHARPLM
ncbi:hypothetical protein EJ05DRAFT_18998 [Pseudovirgaria hyperparasitica]|uniref:Osmotin, thaumatin-like protein n=1 Tax=Pseudovirgaria hyperparasitica TaxID=470096 RepID=A0A6A6WL26_9PEZI|nr:uncharacterized protein EJ05DRAFT_18998 [Pseudovirgaria hyperparasitica]KAF2762888.1 hypothetical protein EJ05DRAFT_18998 [Pseudovirgaria hyperparasitica]